MGRVWGEPFTQTYKPFSLSSASSPSRPLLSSRSHLSLSLSSRRQSTVAADRHRSGPEPLPLSSLSLSSPASQLDTQNERQHRPTSMAASSERGHAVAENRTLHLADQPLAGNCRCQFQIFFANEIWFVGSSSLA